MQIEVRNGAFHYPNGKSVLQSVNFSFDGRGVFAVLGPNGAGKTTGCARQKRENRRLLAAEPHRLDGLRPCHGACRYPCAG